MRRAVMAVELDDPLADPLGLKEAALMALEPLGGRARVTVVQITGEEQLAMAGTGPSRPARPAPAGAPAQGGQAPARPRLPQEMECCLNCAHYRKGQRGNGGGALSWGACAADGKALDEVNRRCDFWARAQRLDSGRRES